MKYMLLLTQAEWVDSGPEEERQRHYAAIMEWRNRLVGDGTIVEGHQLQGPHTATTVALNGRGEPTIHDGPFMESKETIGGYFVIDAPDLDAAIALARSFPAPGCKVEVRPVVER